MPADRSTCLFRGRWQVLMPVIGIVFGFSSLTATATAQDAPRFQVPVDCDLATTCSIQNYVDHDATESARDYSCGFLTYDGHKGTDFQTPDLATMRRGVAVLAAADGIVRNIRNGVPDQGIDAWRRAGGEGRELGNAVAVVHGNGWETFYGHLHNGSVLVGPGDRVTAGQPIGMIGLSGKTAFPHVHFQVVHNGKIVDPFVGEASTGACGASAQSMWTEAAEARLAYREAVLLCGGFALSEPQRQSILDKCEPREEGERDASAIVVFAEIAGVRVGDQLRLSITRPDGESLIDRMVPITRNRARQFRFSGKTATGLWPAGTYSGRIVLTRDTDAGRVAIIDTERRLNLR